MLSARSLHPHALAAAVALAATLITSGTALAATDGSWLEIGNPPNPPSLSNYCAAFDSSGDRVLVFRPLDYSTGAAGAVAEVWEFRMGMPDSGWRPLPATGAGPAGRLDARLVVQASPHRLLLYGGWQVGGGPAMSNDVYELPLDGPAAWNVIATTPDTLRVRFGGLLALDAPNQRLVLSGGTAYFGDHYGPVQDTWTLPLDGPAVWSLAAGGPGAPPAREGAQYAWDVRDQRLFLHGGTGAYPNQLADTWVLPFATGVWTQVATSGMQVGRAYGGVLVDAAHDRLLLAPGFEHYSAPPSQYRTFELPLAPLGEWRQSAAADSYDPASVYSAVVHDTRRHALLVVGPLFTQAFALDDTSGWTRLWPPDPVRAPGAATGEVLVSDPDRQAIWWVGGSEYAGFDGLWKLDATGTAAWTWYPQSPPLPASGHAAVLDAAGGRLLVAEFPQFGPSTVTAIDVTGTPARTDVAPAGAVPAPRVDFSLAVDPVRRQLLLFGGQIFLAHFSGHSYADLWMAPLDSLDAWRQLAPAGPPPPARGEHFAFWDEAHARMVMLGGWQQGGGPIHHDTNDAWALTFGPGPRWTELDSATWVPPGPGKVTFDPVTRRLFLYVAGTGTTWMRSTDDEDAWVALTTTGPPPAAGPIAFAPWCDRLVLTDPVGDGPASDETWALQLDHVVAALASLEALAASPDAVALAWRVSGAGTFALHRRTDGGAWRALATLRPDGLGRVAYEDRDVSPGQSLAYRLVAEGRVLDEQNVLVPAGATAALAFAGARPAPARGTARLAFALPAATAVRVELFDVRGARVLARDLGVQPAGEHAWAWPETGALRPGLYLVRLQAGAERRDAKVLLLR